MCPLFHLFCQLSSFFGTLCFSLISSSFVMFFDRQSRKIWRKRLGNKKSEGKTMFGGVTPFQVRIIGRRRWLSPGFPTNLCFAHFSFLRRGILISSTPPLLECGKCFVFSKNLPPYWRVQGRSLVFHSSFLLTFVKESHRLTGVFLVSAYWAIHHNGGVSYSFTVWYIQTKWT